MFFDIFILSEAESDLNFQVNMKRTKIRLPMRESKFRGWTNVGHVEKNREKPIASLSAILSVKITHMS